MLVNIGLNSDGTPKPPGKVDASNSIPIKASHSATIDPTIQVPVKTGLTFNLPTDTFGILLNPPDVSRKEPFVVTGLITYSIQLL